MAVTRHWLIPDTMHAAATAQAAAEGVSLAEWVRVALTLWVEDLPQVRVTTPEIGDEPPPGGVTLPESAEESLRNLARDPSTRRLNLWLALLAEARWPVTQVAAPLLEVTPQSVSKRVKQGQKTLDTAEDLDRLLSRLPPVPDAPDATQKTLPGEELVGLTMRIDEELLGQVTEKVTRERISASQAVRTAIRERFARLGLDTDGRPLHQG